MAGFCELATSLQGPIFGILREKSAIVSGGHSKNSRFWETGAGDWVRSALRGRACNITRQILRLGRRAIRNAASHCRAHAHSVRYLAVAMEGESLYEKRWQLLLLRVYLALSVSVLWKPLDCRATQVLHGTAHKLSENQTPDAGEVVRQSPQGKLPILSLSALGIVFGDIGTSPLYTFKAILGTAEKSADAGVVLGALSLVLWDSLHHHDSKVCLVCHARRQ
jgi:hypothetical protein